MYLSLKIPHTHVMITIYHSGSDFAVTRLRDQIQSGPAAGPSAGTCMYLTPGAGDDDDYDSDVEAADSEGEMIPCTVILLSTSTLILLSMLILLCFGGLPFV